MIKKVCTAGVLVVLTVTACAGGESGARGPVFRGGGTRVVTATAKGIGFSVPTFPWLSRAEQIDWLKDFRSLGVTWIRFGVTWAVVRPTRSGPYRWGRYDRAVGLADAYGLHVDAQADYSARWAETAGCHVRYEECQPASPGLYAAYAAAIARHFRHGISAEEIWNEPNNVAFWHPAPDPAFYARMLKDSYTAIKAADPQMIVVSGGLAPEPDNGTDLSAFTFARDLFKYGANGYFDALGDHPYSYPALPDQYGPRSAWSQLAQTRPSLRSILIAHGDTAVPVWITEVGAPTGGPRSDSQARQAAALTQIVRNEKADGFLGPAFIYSFRDLGADPALDGDFFGVLTARGREKLSYQALKRAILRWSPES